MEQKGQCECGACTYEVKGEPLLRGYCHCEICQQYNQKAYADITLVRAKDVTVNESSQIVFKSYASPPLVKRGKCAQCGSPAIEFVNLPLFPKLAILPRQTLASEKGLPASALHIFYHRRKQDVEDGLPKYAGYLKSQWVFTKALLKALLARRA